MSCGDRIRTHDLQVMSLASYLCSTPRPMKEREVMSLGVTNSLSSFTSIRSHFHEVQAPAEISTTDNTDNTDGTDKYNTDTD